MELNSLVFPRPANDWKPGTLVNQLVFIPRKPLKVIKRNHSPCSITNCLRVPRMQTTALKSTKDMSWWATGTEEVTPEEEMTRQSAQKLVSRPLIAGKSIGMLNKIRLKRVSLSNDKSILALNPKAETRSTHPNVMSIDESMLVSQDESQYGLSQSYGMAQRPRPSSQSGDIYVQKSLASLKNSLRLFHMSKIDLQRPISNQAVAKAEQSEIAKPIPGKSQVEMLKTLQKISPMRHSFPEGWTQPPTPAMTPLRNNLYKPALNMESQPAFKRIGSLAESTKSIAVDEKQRLSALLDIFDYEQLTSIPGILLHPPNYSDSIAVYFHANGEDIYQAKSLCQALADKLNLWVLIPEFPGYSLYKSKSPEEHQVLKDAERIYEFLHKEVFIPAHKIVGYALSNKKIE